MSLVNSQIEFEIYTSNSGITETFKISMNDILYCKVENSETVYALREEIDNLFEVPLNCAFSFKPVRSKNSGALGIVTRIK